MQVYKMEVNVFVIITMENMDMLVKMIVTMFVIQTMMKSVEDN